MSEGTDQGTDPYSAGVGKCIITTSPSERSDASGRTSPSDNSVESDIDDDGDDSDSDCDCEGDGDWDSDSGSVRWEMLVWGNSSD